MDRVPRSERWTGPRPAGAALSLAFGYLLNCVLVLGAILLAAGFDVLIRSTLEATPEGSSPPWDQFANGVGFLLVLSPVMVMLPVAVLSVILAVAPRPRSVAVATTTAAGVFVGVGIVVAGWAEPHFGVLLVGAGVGCGLLFQIPRLTERAVEIDVK